MGPGGAGRDPPSYGRADNIGRIRRQRFVHEILQGMIAVEGPAGGRNPRRIITVRTHALGHGQHAEDPKTVRAARSVGTRRALPGGKHKKIGVVKAKR